MPAFGVDSICRGVAARASNCNLQRHWPRFWQIHNPCRCSISKLLWALFPLKDKPRSAAPVCISHARFRHATSLAALEVVFETVGAGQDPSPAGQAIVDSRRWEKTRPRRLDPPKPLLAAGSEPIDWIGSRACESSRVRPYQKLLR